MAKPTTESATESPASPLGSTPKSHSSSTSLSTLASDTAPAASFAKSRDSVATNGLPSSIERPPPTASTSIRASISRTSVALPSASSSTTWFSKLDTPGGGQLSNIPTRTSVAGQAEEGHNYPPSTTERELRELPPVDTGFHAMQYLIAATLLETIIWGYATSYGVLLDYYLRTDLAKEPGAGTILPLVGTVNTGTMYCLSPVLAGFLNRYPTSKRPLMYIGLALAVTSMLAASFAKTSIQLLLSEGVGFALGGVMLYWPAMSFLPEWFVARRGFANGTIFAGTGAGGLVFPFILEGLLNRYSLATTLRAVAIGIALTIGPCIPFIRPRVPPAKRRDKSSPRPRTTILGDTQALKNARLWIFLGANTLQGLSFFLPSLYLPTYTQSLRKHTSTSGSIVLAAMNATSIVSRAGVGILSDKYPPHSIGALLLLSASAMVLGIWGGAGATGIAALVIFAACFGLSAGGWTSLYFGIIRECSDDIAAAMTLYGAISLTRGLGNILSGPISSNLMQRRFDAPEGSGFAINHDMFSSIILVCGLSMAAAGLIEVGLAVGGRRKLRTA